MRKLIAGAMITGLVVVGGASSAFAGEVTGNNKITPVSGPGGFVAGSICAFSGLDDHEEDGTNVAIPGETQTWGQGVRGAAAEEGNGVSAFAREHFLHDEGPGTNCVGFASGGGE
jgi:hypothetical protein